VAFRSIRRQGASLYRPERIAIGLVNTARVRHPATASA
jgi:hypothetical protein